MIHLPEAIEVIEAMMIKCLGHTIKRLFFRFFFVLSSIMKKRILEEAFNPNIKHIRLQEELHTTHEKLNQTIKELKESEKTWTSFNEKQTRNILVDSPTEIVLRIMRFCSFEDVMSIIDAVPQLEGIYKDNRLSEWFFKKYCPKLTHIEDYEGFMRSKILQEFDQTTKQHFSLPAGTYLIGTLKRILRGEIYKDLRTHNRWKYAAGVFKVNEYKGLNGTYAVFQANNHILFDSDGHEYISPRSPRFCTEMGCVPLEIVKESLQSTLFRRNERIIDSEQEIHGIIRPTESLELSWRNKSDQGKLTKTLKINLNP